LVVPVMCGCWQNWSEEVVAMTERTHNEQRDYRKLPEPVRLENTIATQDAAPPHDPDGDRNPERDFMLRYAG
jgi:hypothetical protein